MPERDREAILAAEYERARELVHAGVLRGIWRVPGALANVSIWRATSATELHSVLSGLPLARWMEFEVTALADHPVALDTGLVDRQAE
jgi:muconolactone D-isomerase